ncbi:hypothetical protein AVEN_155082-1 [Araneus ventricosus]|uniref:Uncharacterized protein n=1 Tax=Araneus ventricosus TaxID=182803 RepID=A0A4Y2A7N8_ARAVE|nr:hypothetical protein AVEN_155082-1 [Araneus ventricosus]
MGQTFRKVSKCTSHCFDMRTMVANHVRQKISEQNRNNSNRQVSHKAVAKLSTSSLPPVETRRHLIDQIPRRGQQSRQDTLRPIMEQPCPNKKREKIFL